MSPADAIVAAILLPLVGGVLISLCGSRPNLREAVTVATSVLLFADVLSLLPIVLDGGRPSVELIQTLPGISIAFTVEPLGMIFALVASGLWIVTSIYSIGYMRGNNEHNQTRFYVCFAIALSATMGVAFAGNLMTLFVFYEALTLSTYPLVTHHGDEESMKAGRVYMGILMSTSIGFMLVAILWTWVIADTIDFKPGGILADRIGGAMTGVLLALYMYGIGKAALMPVHRWLPAAMVAPTPVSALLHAVAVVKAGVFCVVKVIVYVFGIDMLQAASEADWLVYVAGLTILVASTIALRQDNLKRRLAYSTISQLSYVILAAAILTPLSVMAAALHIAAHAFGKITLFFAAGSIYTASHKTNVSQLAGIGRRMPWTMGAFAIGAISMVGLPPTAGFISKWYLLMGAWEAQHVFALAVILLSTLLNAGYFLPIVYAAFFRPAAENSAHEHGEAPLPIVIALVVTAALTVLMFWLPDTAIELSRQLIGLSP
jgi:multicomponent Na+:H+ antiporter subunit D